MTEKKTRRQDRKPVLPHPSVLRNESREDYLHLYDRIYSDINPQGIIEEILVGDITNLIWEASRWRRYGTAVMQSSLENEVTAEVEEDQDEAPGDEFERVRAQHSERDITDLLNEPSVMAMAMIDSLPHLQALERLTTATEARRNRMFEQLTRYRASFALKARDVPDRVTDEMSTGRPKIARVRLVNKD